MVKGWVVGGGGGCGFFLSGYAFFHNQKMLVYLTKYIRYPNIVIVEAEETGLTYTSSRDCVVGRQVVIVVYLPETLDLRLTPDIGLRSLCEAKQEKQFFILNLFCVFH